MDLDTPPRVGKRARSVSSASSSSSLGSSGGGSSAGSPPPFNKVLRAAPRTEASGSAGDSGLECNLPPTCFPEAKTFDSAAELDRHQLAFHTFICRTPVRDKTGSSSTGGGGGSSSGSAGFRPAQAAGVWDVPREFTSRRGGEIWKECRKVFPDQRLLDLHLTECHDSVSRQKQRDGLAIFQCFVPPPECTRVFTNPKSRRLHLIQKHKYPDQYYFAITNHGLNRIAEEEGLGASLIRPRKEWIPPDTSMTATAEASVPAPEGKEGDNEVKDVDIEMDDLTKGMSRLESSLSFVPAQLRRKAKGKGKAAPTPAANAVA